jgi:hypothetical protein
VTICLGNKPAICSAIDVVTVAFEAEKLKTIPDGVGDDSEQFIPQQSRAILASGDASPRSAFGQQSIIPSFAECNGVPDTTLQVIDNNKHRNVSRFTIRMNIGRGLWISQQYN